MGAEAGVDEQAGAVAGLAELEEEDARAEVVDLRQAEGGEGGAEFGGDAGDVEGGEALFHFAGGVCGGGRGFGKLGLRDLQKFG